MQFMSNGFNNIQMNGSTQGVNVNNSRDAKNSLIHSSINVRH